VDLPGFASFICELKLADPWRCSVLQVTVLAEIHQVAEMPTEVVVFWHCPHVEVEK